jgi:hypothetical protein
VPAPDDPADSDAAATPPPPSGPQAIGGDGPYFAVDAPEWTLDYAWRIAAGDGSSFILYKNGDRQISTMTGEVAEEAISEIHALDASNLDSGDPGVDVYRWSEGVSYVWETSDGTAAVVTFGQMTLDDAETLTDSLIAIEDETFADMVATRPFSPTTMAEGTIDS